MQRRVERKKGAVNVKVDNGVIKYYWEAALIVSPYQSKTIIPLCKVKETEVE